MLLSCLCGAPSLTRGRVCNLQCNHSMVEVEVTLRLTVSQSVCLGIEHPCGSCDQILLPVGMLLSCLCGAPSLTRGRACNLQCNHSKVRNAQNPKPYFTVSSETPNLESESESLYGWQSVCFGVEPTFWTFDQILLPFQVFGSEMTRDVNWRPTARIRHAAWFTPAPAKSHVYFKKSQLHNCNGIEVSF
jgi:hypothetical protein